MGHSPRGQDSDPTGETDCSHWMAGRILRMLRSEPVQRCWGVASRQRCPWKLPVGVPMETAGNHAGVLEWGWGSGAMGTLGTCHQEADGKWARALVEPTPGEPAASPLELAGRPPTGLCPVALPAGTPPGQWPPLNVLGLSPTQQKPGEAKPAGTRKPPLPPPGLSRAPPAPATDRAYHHSGWQEKCVPASREGQRRLGL